MKEIYITNAPRAADNRAFSKKEQTLQVYEAKELTEMLGKCGFNVLGQRGIEEEKFSKIETERIFTIAWVKNDCEGLLLSITTGL